MKILNLIGEKFGKLTVLEETKDVKNHRAWICKCDCGNITHPLPTNSLRSGNTQSCGKCIRKDYNNLTATKEGRKLYTCWLDMIRRCYNTNANNYNNYGARGITVCSEWKNDFISFYNWAINNGFNANKYGKLSGCYSLDRIDNNGNYEPSNCKFSSKREQNINKRPTIPNTSGFTGICKHSSGDYWYGRVRDKTGKIRFTGMSKDIIVAVKMRNNYIKKHKLENKLNII